MRHRMNTGFTLVELLVAIAIMAVISVIGYGGLRGILNAERALTPTYDELQILRDAMMVLESDLEQIVARGVRDELGGYEPPLSAPADQPVVRLTRHAALSALGASAVDLRRVEYSLEDGVLTRSVWPTLDRAPGDSAYQQPLLRDVAALRFRFFDQSWNEFWPVDDDRLRRERLPRGIEVTIEFVDRGALRRVFLLDSTT